MQQKHQAQLKETSATHDRNQALTDPDDCMSDFRGLIRIAPS